MLLISYNSYESIDENQFDKQSFTLAKSQVLKYKKLHNKDFSKGIAYSDLQKNNNILNYLESVNKTSYKTEDKLLNLGNLSTEARFDIAINSGFLDSNDVKDLKQLAIDNKNYKF